MAPSRGTGGTPNISESVSILLRRGDEFLARIDHGFSLTQVLEELIYGIEDRSENGMLASVLLLDTSGKYLRHGAAPSLPPAYTTVIDGLLIGPTAGSCGTAAHSGNPVFVTDIATDPLWKDYRELALAHDLRACWSVPIKDEDGRVLGTFALHYRELRRPSEADQNLIAQAADIVLKLIRKAG
jgi:GAF domain-containing protein